MKRVETVGFATGVHRRDSSILVYRQALLDRAGTADAATARSPSRFKHFASSAGFQATTPSMCCPGGNRQ
jgi:hypothetical protein